MKSLKICMVTTFYPPFNFGGDGIFVQRLANALANDGHEVHVVHDRDAFEFVARDLPQQNYAVSSDRSHSAIQLKTIGDGTAPTADLVIRHQLGRPSKRQAVLEKLLSQEFDVLHFHNVSLMGGPQILELGRAKLKLCTLH